MDWFQLAIRFVLGGSVVVLVTLIAAYTKNAQVAGIAAAFPTVLIAAAISLSLSGHDSAFLSRYFLGTLAGIAIVLVFSLAAVFSIRQWGILPGLALATIVWLTIASAVVFRGVARS